MPQITPNLWYDKEAKEAAELYCSIFPNSKITRETVLRDTPSGDAQSVSFEVLGHPFSAISAGPLFKFTPAVSFLVSCGELEEVDAYWKKLAEGGTTLMSLDSYPFSKRYGWTSDRYGLSWQVMYSDEPTTQRVIPTLLFVGEVCGKVEEAIRQYTSLFPNSNSGAFLRYEKGDEPEKEGTIKHADFSLDGQRFAAMDSALEHNFTFNEAISFMVNCKDQKEIDYYWKLSADPEAEQCGWIKDKYGLSWQVTPTRLGEMMRDGTREQIDRVVQAFLPMKKFDVAELEKAYKG